MTGDTPDYRELFRLLSELTDGTLSDNQVSRLRELLRDDPAARVLYREYMGLHARLHLDYASGAAPPTMPAGSSMPATPLLADAIVPTGGDHGGNGPEIAGPAEKFARIRAVKRGAMAAAILFALLSGAVLFQFRWRGPAPLPLPPTAVREPDGPEDGGRRDPASGEPVAVLARVVDARWESNEHPTEEGSELPAGRLRLAAGWVQVDFLSGASVIIEGPADFELISSIKAFCHQGKLWTHVHPNARGFTISTPSADAVDLGTEYAMSVDEKGRGEVRVLDGKVELHGAGDQPMSGDVRTLEAGRGIRFGPGDVPHEFDSDPGDYVGGAKLLDLKTVQQRIRYKEWLAHSRALRADPATILYYDFERQESWDRTLRDLGNRSDAARDGAIVGCPWTEGRWPGKGALEFKRVGDRVRINVPGTFGSLTLAAWVRIEGFNQWLSSLLLTDDYDPGEVHWQLSNKGELIFGVRGTPSPTNPRGNGIHVTSPAVLGPSDLGRWVHLAAVYDAPGKVVVFYLDGRPIGRHPVNEPLPTCIGAAEIGNWTTHMRMTCPIRSLNGRVDEFGIFSRAFSEDEIRTMYELGRPNT